MNVKLYCPTVVAGIVNDVFQIPYPVILVIFNNVTIVPFGYVTLTFVQFTPLISVEFTVIFIICETLYICPLGKGLITVGGVRSLIIIDVETVSL